MFESLLTRLAGWLGVQPAQAGEALKPQIRFEQPWPQWAAIGLFLLAAALIVAVYRREGKASTPYKMTLAGLRVLLVVLAMFMLSEAVLSVERTGLPYFAILVDDSASQGVADRVRDAAQRKAIEDLGLATNPDSQDAPSRIAESKAFLTRDNASLLRKLQEKHKVKIYAVSSAARPIATIEKPEEVEAAVKEIEKVDASGAQSRLGSGVRQVLTELRGVAPTAIVLLTDGQTTDGESLERAAELAKRKGVPIFSVGLGDPDRPRDLELNELLVDEFAFKDDLIPFKAKVLSQGFEGTNLTVKLSRSVGDSKEKTPLDSKVVKAPKDGVPLPIEIVHQPKETGDFRFILEIEPQDREIQVANNVIERTVSVREETLKVLLVEGMPRFEFRFIKFYLERDKTIDLGVVLLSSDPEYSDQDSKAIPTFPSTAEELEKYDVVILGDVDPAFFSAGQLEHINDFVVKRGGGLLFIAGPFFNPAGFKGTVLETLLPVELAEARDPSIGVSLSDFRPNLTAQGRGSPIFRFGNDEVSSLRIWENLPKMFWYYETPKLKPAAVVLAEHPKPTETGARLPLLAFQYVGAGKTMYNGFDETYLWRFRGGDRYFNRFWIQTIRFLAKSKLLQQKQAEITTDRLRYQRGQPVQLRVRFPNPALARGISKVNVQVQRKGQGPRTISLDPVPTMSNIFEGALPQGPDGDYVAKLLPPPVLQGTIPTTEFRIDPPAGEMERIQMNEPELRRVAEATGGRFYTLATLSTLFEDLPEPQMVPLDTDPPIPLWNTWPVLALFLVIIVLEWILRKRKQMV